MQPTVDADLRAARLAIARVVAEEDVSPEAIAGLEEVSRTIGRVERSWARVLPYLVFENRATAGLLAELAPLVSEDVADEIAALRVPRADDDDLAQFDAGAVNELNGRLRGILAQVIRALPAGEAGAQPRTAIRLHLERTLALRPW